MSTDTTMRQINSTECDSWVYYQWLYSMRLTAPLVTTEYDLNRQKSRKSKNQIDNTTKLDQAPLTSNSATSILEYAIEQPLVARFTSGLDNATFEKQQDTCTQSNVTKDNLFTTQPKWFLRQPLQQFLITHQLYMHHFWARN